MTEHPTYSREQQPVATLAEVFLRSTARLIEIQAAAARAFVRTQGRTSALFGGPDWSTVYSAENERRFSEALSAGTEQAVSFVRQSSATILQLQDAVKEHIERQTGALTSELRANMEEIGRRVEESADEARRAGQRASQVVQQPSGLEGTRAKHPA